MFSYVCRLARSVGSENPIPLNLDPDVMFKMWDRVEAAEVAGDQRERLHARANEGVVAGGSEIALIPDFKSVAEGMRVLALGCAGKVATGASEGLMQEAINALSVAEQDAVYHLAHLHSLMMAIVHFKNDMRLWMSAASGDVGDEEVRAAIPTARAGGRATGSRRCPGCP